MKYRRLVVFIRYDSSEIWGFRYGLKLGIGDLSIMASLKRSQSHSHQNMGQERDFYEGRQRTEETERQPRIVSDLIKL
jgi:hypothetical protein